MTSRFPIERIDARILDIPTVRPHRLSLGSISCPSPATIGGPSWNEQSPEGTRRTDFFRSHPKTT
jgi:muconate cycloisomerase